MTAQGSAYGRFTRAVKARNLFQVEIALRELSGLEASAAQPPMPGRNFGAAGGGARGVSLLDALDYLDLLAELKPEKLEQAALRWHGRLELEANTLSIAESQLALSALAALCAGQRDAIPLLRQLLRRVKPTSI